MNDQPHFSLVIDQEIELRLFAEEEAAELMQLIEGNRAHLRQWLPWVDYNTSVEDSRQFILRSKQQYVNNEGFQLGIRYRGQLAGVIGYHSVDWPNRTVEIGYWQGAAFQGRGLMTCACRALVTYAFEKLLLNRVQIRCAPGNTRSCAVPQRLGFTQEGLLRDAEWLYDHFVDLVIYSILAREWHTSTV